jgi:hypothetical protein
MVQWGFTGDSASFLPHFGGLNLDVFLGRRQKLPPGHKAWLSLNTLSLKEFDKISSDFVHSLISNIASRNLLIGPLII